jgi:hypothetical protein
LLSFRSTRRRALRAAGPRAQRAAFADAGEDQIGVRVFVIDAEQSVARAVGAGRQRVVADIVVLVAELQRMRGGSHALRIESGRVSDHRIAPADQHLDVIPGRDMVGRVLDVRDLRETER